MRTHSKAGYGEILSWAAMGLAAVFAVSSIMGGQSYSKIQEEILNAPTVHVYDPGNPAPR